MRTLMAIFISLMLTAPAWALPSAGHYTIQFTAYEQGGPNPDGTIPYTPVIGPVGTFSTNGATFTQWNFSIAAYDTLSSWNKANSFVSATTPDTLRLLHGTPENADDRALVLYFLTSTFETTSSFDSFGTFDYHAATHAVPAPNMLWLTIMGFMGLVWFTTWRTRYTLFEATAGTRPNHADHFWRSRSCDSRTP